MKINTAARKQKKFKTDTYRTIVKMSTKARKQNTHFNKENPTKTLPSVC